jgi:hypothetical protein
VTTSSDLIRVRAPSREAESGSLPIDQAVAFVERSRDLVLAAACAAITKRAYFATRKPTKATEHLSCVRVGQTERGSYVLTILSPVPPALAPEGELPLDLEPPEPYERQVTRILAEGLAAMEHVARKAASSGGMAAFEHAVSLGVSANPCEAVAGLSAVSLADGLDIRIAWSRTPPAAPSIPSRIVLGSDSIPLIQEAAGLFKDTAPVEDVEIQGFVTRLARGPQERSGEATLEGLVDGQLRRAAVELGEGIYSQAVQVHDQRQRVACAGDLVKVRIPATEPVAFPGPVGRGSAVSVCQGGVVSDHAQVHDGCSSDRLRPVRQCGADRATAQEHPGRSSAASSDRDHRGVRGRERRRCAGDRRAAIGRPLCRNAR